MKYRFVIFDLDGTLIDSYRALTTAINRTGATLGRDPLTEEQVKGLVGEGVERLLQKTFSLDHVDAALIDRFEREYEAVCCEQSTSLHDVDTTIHELHDAGLRLAVCTNKPTRFSQQILEHLGLARYFEAVVGPDLAGARKPDPRHVLDTLARIDGVAAETLFVGDMPIDIRAARASSVDVAVIATGSASIDELRALDPDIVLHRFADLLGVLMPSSTLECRTSTHAAAPRETTARSR